MYFMNHYLLAIIFISTPFLCGVECAAQGQVNIGQLTQELAKHTTIDSNRVDILGKLSSAYRLVMPDSARMYSEEAISTARLLNNPFWLAKSLVSASSTMIEIGEFQRAASILREAIEIGKKEGIPNAEIRALSNLGALYRRIGAPDKAQQYMMDAYDKAVNLKNSNLMANLSLNIGNLYIDIEDYDKALIEFQKCLAPLRLQRDWNAYALVYMNIGVTHTNLKEYEMARIAFDSCQSVIDRYELLPVRQVNLTVSKAVLYLDGLKQPDITIHLLEELFSKKGLAIPKLTQARSYQLLAVAYLEIGQTQKALELALKCKLEIDAMGLKSDLQTNTYGILSEIYAKQNNWQQAYTWAQESIVQRDSMDIQAKRQAANYAMITREIESNEKALTEANNQLKINATVYKTIGIVAIPLIVLIVFALFYRYRLRLQKQYSMGLEAKVAERTKDLEIAHVQIQEAKERENISLAMLNQQHSELLEITIEKMQSWQKQNGLADIQSTINDLKAAQTKADEWGSFMLHFERIHPNFAQSLQAQFPELNANDLKHCAYMRLGMTRKQVADTLHTSENAVRLSRNRIRKKVGLEADDSLQSFLDQWGISKEFNS